MDVASDAEETPRWAVEWLFAPTWEIKVYPKR